jgi:hypothetical protein
MMEALYSWRGARSSGVAKGSVCNDGVKMSCVSNWSSSQKVEGRVRDVRSWQNNVHCVLAELVLGETSQQSKDVRQGKDCSGNLSDCIWKLVHGSDEQLQLGTVERFGPDWQNEVSNNMAQLQPTNQVESLKLAEVITARVQQDSAAYRQRLRNGLEKFTGNQSHRPSKDCESVIVAIQDSFRKYESGPERLASVELTAAMLSSFKQSYCSNLTEPASLTKENRELLETLIVLGSASENSKHRELVMDILKVAFDSADKVHNFRDLTEWLLPLGQWIRVMLGWKDLLKETVVRDNIERKLKLVDSIRSELDLAGWERQLTEWVAQAGPGEQRLKAANLISHTIKVGVGYTVTRHGDTTDVYPSSMDKELKIVDLSRLKLKSLPSAIGLMKGVRKLSLYRNQLASLPASLALLTDLECITLHQNNLKRLPESIESLINLRFLKVSDNQLEMLPEWLGSLPMLSCLCIFDNNFRKSPNVIGSLPKLRELLIDRRDLRMIKKSVELPPNLEIRCFESAFCEILNEVALRFRSFVDLLWKPKVCL